MKRNTITRWISAALCLVLLFALALPAAAGVPSRPNGSYVVDEANVLSAQTENSINGSAGSLYASTGAELVVVTVENTGRTDIEDFAEDIYETWNISNAGILLVLSIGEDDYYALYGAAVTSYFQNDISDILYTYLEDDFARGNYDAGVQKVCTQFENRLRSAVNDLTGGTYNGAANGYADYAQTSPMRTAVSLFARVLSLLFYVIIIVVVISIILSF